MVLRIAFILLVVAPLTVLALPFQVLILALGLPVWQVLPRLFFRLLAFGLGLKVTVLGAPVRTGAVLLVANHISWLDIPAIAARVPVSFVAKSEVARYPVVGWLAKLQRTVFVDRTRRTDTGRTAREMSALMGRGGTVLLFAEGTSDIGTHVLPFRSALLGAAQAALAGGAADAVAIQPLAIAYTHVSGLPLSRHQRPQIAWIGDMGMGDNLRHILSSGPKRVVIAFGDPLPGDGDRKTVARQAEDAVRAMLVAINRQGALPNTVL